MILIYRHPAVHRQPFVCRADEVFTRTRSRYPEAEAQAATQQVRQGILQD